jgi:hypothetical protein
MQNQQQEKNTIAIAKFSPTVSYKTKDLAWTFFFALAAVIFPALLAHTPANQWITGTIVNAILFLAVWRVGLVNAAFVGALPSSIALLRGLLPAPMAVLIPFIILSNIILVAAFFALKKYPLAGVIASSFVKFLFLFAVTSFFLKVASPLLVMMHWPQLFTALAGGLIAVGVIKKFKKYHS